MRQATPVDIGDLGRIKVDVGTARFVKDLGAAVATCDIAPESPFLGFYNIPGVALATRTIPIVTPGINNVAQAATILSLAPTKTGPLVIAVLRSQDGSPRITIGSRLISRGVRVLRASDLSIRGSAHRSLAKELALTLYGCGKRRPPRS
jgi:hypothetical protein